MVYFLIGGSDFVFAVDVSCSRNDAGTDTEIEVHNEVFILLILFLLVYLIAV